MSHEVPPDFERLGMAAYLSGRETEALEALGRAYHTLLDRGETTRAARCAFWTAFLLIQKGDRAQAGGWLARARRLLDAGQLDCVERGYLLLPAAIEHVAKAEFDEAGTTFAEAVAIGERFADLDLISIARSGQGRVLIALGQTADGVSLLDEVMVAAIGGELSPIATGTAYCSVLAACFDIFDFGRAREWTAALDTWCAAQPEAVPFRGECLVHRSEILQLHGAWADALAEARRACDRLGRQPARPLLGAAWYQLAEVHRLRGAFDQAEAAYDAASHAGRTPYPGLALLRLAQGRLDTAAAAIGRVLEEVRGGRVRSIILAAAVEILLASGDLGGARRAADELASIAEMRDTPFLRALSARALGSMHLAAGDARMAMPLLRRACTTWRELDAPYEAARTALLIARACRALGDSDSERLDLDAARSVFESLGAAPDIAAMEASPAAPANPAATGLTPRELEVLQLIASGKTNRAIGDALHISEKTVARHVSNIFTKLDLSSRAAATAYAFHHRLV